MKNVVSEAHGSHCSGESRTAGSSLYRRSRLCRL